MSAQDELIEKLNQLAKEIKQWAGYADVGLTIGAMTAAIQGIYERAYDSGYGEGWNQGYAKGREDESHAYEQWWQTQTQ